MPQTHPSVTIGVPVVNEIDFLPLAIRSVFAQTFSGWRLIILADNATREVLELVNAISDPRVSVISDGESRGLPARLNEITGLAETPLVCRMDADDIMHPERLASQVAYFGEHPETDVLGTRCYIIDELSTVHGRSKEPAIPTTSAGYLQSGVFFHPSVMFTRQWSLQNPYDVKWSRTQDKELWLRSHRESRFAKLDEPFLYYRIPRELSLEKYSRSAKWDRKVLRTYAPLIGESRFSLERLLATSRAKQMTMAAAVALGATDRVYRRRSLPLTLAERERAVAGLVTVAATSVAGWDAT